MPHCQKEKHDHTAKSKKERQQKKEEMLARRKAAKARELEAELEAAKLKPNNIFLSDGFGEYLVGCEPEKELKAPRFNVNKRSKKHLRIDVRKKEERKEREEQEQLKKEKEEQYRLQQEKLKQEAAGSGNHEEEEQEQEEEPIIKEYLVYICQCCYKKFNTTNQFVNHSNSKKHRYNARLYEEAGVIVTEIQVRRNNDDDDVYSYEEEDYEEDDEFDQGREECGEFGSYYDNGDDSEEDEEEDEDEDDDEDEEPATKAHNVFSAFADDSDSSSESSSDSSDEEDEDIAEVPAVSSGQSDKDDNDDNTECDDHDDLDILEEIIYQNRLQERFFPESDVDEEDNASKTVVPVPYDGEWYNPDNLNADENRLASIQHRLQKRLAARGIEPSRVNTGYTTSSDAVSIGKTLLQQVMEASFETLEARLAAYNKHKAEYQLLGREFRFAGGNSKALPSQYTFRIDPADNSRRRENTHHTGSHYHMANARSMNHGRIKGMLARHSSQGARLQSSRMAAKEMARVQGGGLKIGKTSKKSQQKRKGEAGGSKKSGGTASEK